MLSEAPHPFLLSLALLVTCVASLTAAAQEPQVGQLNAPPPLKTISKEERTQIENGHDTKSRLKTIIDLAQSHLAQAEKLTNDSNFQAASHQFGTYEVLIENAMSMLAAQRKDVNKTRDLYKHLELSLRADAPRLTALRRITPLEFAVWIKEVEDFARESRTEALNSFYGQTVVREPKSENDQKPKESPTPSKTP
jgi:hypothetical protein